MSNRSSGPGPGSWPLLTGALVVFALLSACQKIWDTDIFWHLTEGEWALRHHTLLRIDHWSASGLPRPIVAVYTLYHLVITPLHSLAGFAGLSILNMLLFAAIAIVLAGAIPARSRGAAAALCLAAGLFVTQGRMRMRPESFTFLYLAVTIAILEGVRRGELPARRLLWLAPLMAVWANMHSLFAVGLATIWMAVIGKWIDARRPPWEWVRAAGLATLACLINPTPIQIIRLPLDYFGQINAHVSTYAFGFAEFLPSWKEPGAPEFIAVIAVVLVAAAGMAIAWRKRGAREIPVAHLLWLAAFAYLGATAFRNLALAGVVQGYLAASHAGALIPGRRRWAVRGASAAIVLLGISYITGEAGAVLHRTGRPGVGLLDDFFPLEIAENIAASGVPGDILPLDFGDGGPLIYAANRSRIDPKQIIHRVYIDGRSDLHPQERYVEVFRIESEITSSPDGADRVTLPPGVRFLVVNFNDLEAIRSLGASTRFRLFCLDRNHACFTLSDDAKLLHLGRGCYPFDLTLSLDRPDALLGPAASYQRSWLRRHPLDTQWRLGIVFSFLGREDLAERYLECAEMLDIGPRPEREGMLAMVLARLDEALDDGHAAIGDFMPTRRLAGVDPLLARALYLLRRPGVCDPRTEEGRTHAIQKILLLNRVGARDLAAEEVDRLVRAPGGASDPDLASLRAEIHAGLRDEKQTNPQSPLEQGDALLRIGDVAAARLAYAKMGNDPDAEERLAVCAWAEGDLRRVWTWIWNPHADYHGRESTWWLFAAYLGVHDPSFPLEEGRGVPTPHH